MSSRFCKLRRGMVIFWLVVLLLISTIHTAGAIQFTQLSLDGEAVFKASCEGCHTIGEGISIGPDLKGVTQVREQQWLVDFISNPGEVVSSGDATATSLVKQYNNRVMPNLGLSREQVSSVINYLEAQATSTAVITVTTTVPFVMAEGNPDNGKAIFTQEVHLVNGGPACISCHSIDNAGILGGGALGPDLTQAIDKYGEAGLAAFLASPNTPTMQLIFTEYPLTPEEQADLVAFIKSSMNQRQSDKLILVLGLSLGGFLAVMGVAAFYWRGRLRSVRAQLVKNSMLPKSRGKSG